MSMTTPTARVCGEDTGRDVWKSSHQGDLQAVPAQQRSLPFLFRPLLSDPLALVSIESTA